MKKNFWLVVGCLVFGAPSLARAHVGILGGLTFTGIAEDSSSGSTGFIGGLAFTKKLTAGPLLEVDVLYDGRNPYANSRIDFIQVPILFRFEFPSILNLGIGPYVAGVVAHRRTPNTTEIGVVGSVQLLFPLANGNKFVIDGRYLRGLTDQGFKSHNSEFNVLIGILF